MTGDYKWLSVGQLFSDYEIELENAAGLGCWNDTFVEIAPVVENDPEKIIDDRHISISGQINSVMIGRPFLTECLRSAFWR